MNYVVGKRTNFKTRFVYLTNSEWAITDFDRFSWDNQSETPLKRFSSNDKHVSVSKLFVRTSLCFLHDVEMLPEPVSSKGPLKFLMDTIVPRRFQNARRLGLTEAKKREIGSSIKELSQGDQDFYISEIDTFYRSWNNKKIPWINLFLRDRATEWADGFEIFQSDGFQAFWKFTNEEFVKSSWQMGIYLAAMSEGKKVLARLLWCLSTATMRPIRF